MFLPVLERELRDFMMHWNTHAVRHNRLADCPGGVPEDLFDMPVHYGNNSTIDVVTMMYTNPSVITEQSVNNTLLPVYMF